MTPNGNNQKKRQRLAGSHKKEESCRSEVKNISVQRAGRILGRCSRRKNKKVFPVIPITLGDAINDYKYSKAMQEIRKELRKLDQEIKKDGGVIDWNRMLNDFI